MPRAHNPGPSTLRNRNRVTNKTRLHIVQGSLDADPLAFDEDEEKARIVSTAGVDAEDANVSSSFPLHHSLGPLSLKGACWHAPIGRHREKIVPRNADSVFPFAQIGTPPSGRTVSCLPAQHHRALVPWSK